MHTVKVLHKLLHQSVPSIHATRLDAVMATVQSVVYGARTTVTSLGRGLTGKAYDKHKIKRVDRLLSNAFLYQESPAIYRALTRCLLQQVPEAIIAIDWSPLCADQQWHLLRAAIPVGGRSLTLYEEVHPRSKLGNRKIQHQFLDRLATMVPTTCQPIIVADSGFRTPFFRYLEEQFNWHWVGRIRSRDFIRWHDRVDDWFGAKLLHPRATTVARRLGVVDWVRKQPLCAIIVLVRCAKKYRKSLTYAGTKRQSRRNKIQLKRAREPWVLVASLSLRQRAPKQIVSIYKTRMQIEEGFRDCKAVHYGLCLSQHRHMNLQRRSVLCLIAACAIFILWCVGVAGQRTQIAKQVRVNSSSKRTSYSTIFLARLLLTQSHFRLSNKAILNALSHINIYMESVLCK
ncbi:MAG: IS4 family transposase [Gammaproteobacteria bacterium]